jgi:hypothetical protein
VETKNLFHLQASLMLDQMKLFDHTNAKQEDFDKIHKKYEETVKKYDKKLPEIVKEAEAIVAEGDEFLEQSHKIHARAHRFDYGELALQLAVVLCSLAILTKGRGFWYAGIASAVIGVLIALTGLFDLFSDGSSLRVW